MAIRFLSVSQCLISQKKQQRGVVQVCSPHKDPLFSPILPLAQQEAFFPSLTHQLRAAILTALLIEPLLRQSRPLTKPVTLATTEALL